MAKSNFNHVRMTGITAVVPETCINIDDEIEHVVEDGVAVSDCSPPPPTGCLKA